MAWSRTSSFARACNRAAFRAAGLALFLIPLAVLWPQAPASLAPSEVEAVVTTSLGVFRFEFAPDKAPRHVEQFIARARQGYYDGTAFFRVVSYGVIQGGDPLLKDAKTPRDLWGTGGLSLLKDEFSDLKHERGVVSTVRVPGKADSDGAQFFVCVSPQAQLDGQFSAFGRVTEGMDVVEKISQTPSAADGLTQTPVRIVKVEIEKKKVEPFVNATPEEMRKTVVMNTTLGTIKIQMQPDWAPNAVRNFLGLTAAGWYDGTSFHRVIKGFVAQGGMEDSRVGSAPHPADRWVHKVKGEFRPDVKHVRGIVSMARGDDPDSATTSFFLMLGDAPHLDGKYTAFGRIVAGVEVLDAFEREEVDGEKPKRRLEIIKATIE